MSAILTSTSCEVAQGTERTDSFQVGLALLPMTSLRFCIPRARGVIVVHAAVDERHYPWRIWAGLRMRVRVCVGHLRGREVAAGRWIGMWTCVRQVV